MHAVRVRTLGTAIGFRHYGRLARMHAGATSPLTYTYIILTPNPIPDPIPFECWNQNAVLSVRTRTTSLNYFFGFLIMSKCWQFEWCFSIKLSVIHVLGLSWLCTVVGLILMLTFVAFFFWRQQFWLGLVQIINIHDVVGMADDETEQYCGPIQPYMFEPVADPLVTQSVNAAGVVQPQPVTECSVHTSSPQPSLCLFINAACENARTCTCVIVQINYESLKKNRNLEQSPT